MTMMQSRKGRRLQPPRFNSVPMKPRWAKWSEQDDFFQPRPCIPPSSVISLNFTKQIEAESDAADIADHAIPRHTAESAHTRAVHVDAYERIRAKSFRSRSSADEKSIS